MCQWSLTFIIIFCHLKMQHFYSALVKIFAIFAGFKKIQKYINFFKIVFVLSFCLTLAGKILFRRSHVRDVAIRRLRFIDDYCRVRSLLCSSHQYMAAGSNMINPQWMRLPHSVNHCLLCSYGYINAINKPAASWSSHTVIDSALYTGTQSPVPT